MESKLHLAPIGLLSAFILKQLILGTSVSEMGVSFALTSAVVAFEYLSKSRKLSELEAVLSKKAESQDEIIKKQNEVIRTMADTLDKVRNSVDGLKASNGASSMLGLTRK